MRLGEVIHDRFVIERFVARGGMGEVYRALDRATNQPVALKLVARHGEFGDDHHLAERFENEARALATLDHPAIVGYVAHGEAPGALRYLAMEWLEGATLSKVVKKFPLSFEDALRLGARVAEGLGAAHALGLVHRDVKPGNLFLVDKRADQAKILDFGLVRDPSHQLTQTGAGMGTPDYMAPEQARCEKHIGPAADVFALGSVLYRALAGVAPFRGDNVKAVLAKIAMLDESPRLCHAMSEVPEVVDDLLAALMAHAPAKRPQSGAAAAELIHAARANLGVKARRRAPTPLPSVGGAEQQPVAVLFVDLERKRRVRFTPADPVGQTVQLPAGGSLEVDVSDPAPASHPAVAAPAPEPDVAPALGFIRQVAEPAGGRVVPLLDGSVVVMLGGGLQGADLATRAARTALAIHALVPGAGVALSMRQVVVGDAHGASPVIDGAAAMARSRRIHIDRRTRELLPPAFVVEGDEAEGFSLVQERAEPVHHRLLGRQRPMVGRGAVMRQLRAAAEGSFDERGALAMVVYGEAGVGKSRLRAELLGELGSARPELQVILAQGDPLRTGVPLGLLARALRVHLDVPAEGGLELKQAALAAKLAPRLGDEDRGRVTDFIGQIVGVGMPSDDSPALRAAFKDPQLMADHKRRAFADWLAAEAAVAPTLFVVDDLHAADALSVELLGDAIERAKDLPLVVLGFGRPELRAAFPKLGDLWGRQELKLEPLRPAAAAELVKQALGDAVSEPAVQKLVERAGGNPFYLEELVRAAASPEPDSLPPSVMVSTQLRIGRQPPRARQVLRAASIFGRTFWVRGVAALLAGEQEEREIHDWLDQLERDELVERQPSSRAFPGESEVMFAHDLLRDAAYQMLTAEDRVTGHRLAGAWLVEKGETDAVVLAEHFAGGGVTDQAVDYFEQAARRALEKGADDVAALRKAASHYRRAGETCAAAYSHTAAIGYFERAVGLWAPIDLAEAARTRLEQAREHARGGERERALGVLATAEDEAARGKARKTLIVEILLERAQLERRGGDDGALKRATAVAESAVSMAKGAKSPELHAKALMALSSALVVMETAASTRQAIELSQKALVMSEAREQITEGLWRLGNAFLIANDLSNAERYYRQCLSSAAAQRDDILQASCSANLGMVEFRRGHLKQAIELTRRARDTQARIGYRTRAQEASLNVATFQHLSGQTAEAVPVVREILAAAQDDWIVATNCEEMLADAERQGGNDRAAQELLRSAARRCERAGSPKRQALFLGQLAESLWSSQEWAEAFRVLTVAARTAKGLTLSHALLLVQLGPLDEAVEWIERFVVEEADAHRRLTARAANVRARMLVGDNAAALEVAKQGLAEPGAREMPRFSRPLVCLEACLKDDAGEAIDELPVLASLCTPAEYVECLADVAELLVRTDAPTAQLGRFLQHRRMASATVPRYRLDDLSATLLARADRVDESLASSQEALRQIDAIRGALTGDYLERFDEHPWVLAAKRLRAVP